jgi:outer membrane protein
MMHRCKTLVTLMLLLAIAPAVSAQQRHELTVRDAVELAYKNVVELKNAQIDYQIQEAQNKEITGRALPQVNANFGVQKYLQVPTILFPDATATAIYSILKAEGVNGSSGPIVNVPVPTSRAVSFQQPWNLQLGGSVTQLLFQPDVFVGLQARKTALELSTANIEQVKDRIKDSAYRRYYAILISEKQLGFIDSSIVRLEKLYRDDSIMYKNGFAERLDLDKVQVQLNNLRATRNLVAGGVQISYAALKFTLGIPQQDTVQLRETLTPEALKEGLLDKSFKYEDRPEIRTLNLARRMQTLDVKRNQLGVFPTVALAGNYSVNGMGKKFFTDSNTFWYRSSFIGLSVNMPVFDGFQRRYRTRQAQLKVEKLDNTISQVKQGIDFQQTASNESLRSALSNLDVSERNLQLALRVYNATKLKFEQGLGSSFEVLQADADYQQAQSAYFNALYNATVARISYQSSLGKLQ